jgi:hypothetical protein
MPVKRREYAALHLRVPPDMRAWLERRADETFTCLNAEAVRAIRVAMALDEKSQPTRSGKGSEAAP